MSNFNESNSDFYDLEYYISLEYRYISGAHRSRIKNILQAIRGVVGEIKGKRILDVGCGGGFFTNELVKEGAIAVGIDYSKFAIQFARDRFKDIDFKVTSGYSLAMFDDNSLDIVLLLDVIEHMNNQDKVLSEIKRVLKQGGYIVISTDVDESLWVKGIMPSFIRRSEYFSKDGRAYKLIKKVEEYRRQFRNYHASHIKELTYDDLHSLLDRFDFKIVHHRIYPLVGVSIRDIFMRLLPKRFRGNHQCIVAQK